jgi:hypothetical protein
MVSRLLKSRSIRTHPLGNKDDTDKQLPDITHSALGEQMRLLRDLRSEGRITDAEYAIEAAAVLHGKSQLSER